MKGERIGSIPPLAGKERRADQEMRDAIDESKEAARGSKPDKAVLKEQLAELFPMAKEIVSRVLQNRKASASLKLRAAELIIYMVLGKPTQPIEADVRGNLTHTEADAVAKAAQESRKAFVKSLEEQLGPEGMEKFKPEELRKLERIKVRVAEQDPVTDGGASAEAVECTEDNQAEEEEP